MVAIAYPARIYVTKTMTYPSYEDAPDEIFVQKWAYGAFYSGYIPIDSWYQIKPGEAKVTYAGYIDFDPSITPDSIQSIK